ncbi:MAG: hypothetical protein GZ089_09250 [Aromatoleum sp.]|nr:hypothetical protein [Aromatoleum sp.]
MAPAALAACLGAFFLILDFFDFAADFDDDDVAFADTAIGAGAADVAAALRAAVTAFAGAAGAGDWAEAVSANAPATNAIRSLLI